jgi:hypothetical protein
VKKIPLTTHHLRETEITKIRKEQLK